MSSFSPHQSCCEVRFSKYYNGSTFMLWKMLTLLGTSMPRLLHSCRPFRPAWHRPSQPSGAHAVWPTQRWLPLPVIAHRGIAHRCIANGCIVKRLSSSMHHDARIVYGLWMMLIASYKNDNDDDHHHHRHCFLHTRWWLSWWLSHCKQMMMIASYTNNDNRHHVDDLLDT